MGYQECVVQGLDGDEAGCYEGIGVGKCLSAYSRPLMPVFALLTGLAISRPDLGIQEQAYHVVRNLSKMEDVIEMVFRELGVDTILDSINEAISLNKGMILFQFSDLTINTHRTIDIHIAIKLGSRATSTDH